MLWTSTHEEFGGTLETKLVLTKQCFEPLLSWRNTKLNN